MTLSELLGASSEPKKLKISKWDILNLPNAVIIMLIGKRGSGKTTLLMDLLYHLRGRFDAGMAVTPTVDTANDFRKCMCDSMIYESMEEADEVITMLTELQGICDLEGKRVRNIYFIADDCMFDKKSFKTTNMRDILFNGRHYNITFINSAQYVMDVGTDYRSQIDYVIVIGEPTPDTRDKLWEIFFKTVFDNNKEGKKQFYYTLKMLTQDHRAMILDNRTTKNGCVSDKIFWYKAEETRKLPSFHLNSTVYQKMHRDTYIPTQVRVDKKKKEIYAKTMLYTAQAHAPSVVQVQLGNTRKPRRPAPNRAAAKPKLPPRPAQSHASLDTDIDTGVTNAVPRGRRSHREPSHVASSHHAPSVSSRRSMKSGHSMSTFVSKTSKRNCHGGLCGVPPAVDRGRLQGSL